MILNIEAHHCCISKYIEKMNIFRPSSYNSKIRSFILESFDPIPWYIEYSVNCALLNWKYISFP